MAPIFYLLPSIVFVAFWLVGIMARNQKRPMNWGRYYLIYCYGSAALAGVLALSAHSRMGPVLLVHLMPGMIAVSADKAQRRATSQSPPGWLQQLEFLAKMAFWALIPISLIFKANPFEDRKTQPPVVDTLEKAEQFKASEALAPSALGTMQRDTWRLRDGTFESTISGLRLPVPEGLTIVPRTEDLEGRSDADFTIVDDPGTYRLEIGATRAPTLAQGQAIQRLGMLESVEMKAFVPDPRAPVWALTFLGDALKFTTIAAPLSKMRRSWLWREGRQYRISVQYALTDDEARTQTQTLLQSIAPLSPSELLKLEQDLAKTRSQQSFISSDAAIRGDLYQNFRHGFTWQRPHSGFWILPAPLADLMLPGSILVADDTRSGVTLTIISPPGLAANPESFHKVFLSNRAGREYIRQPIEAARRNGVDFLTSSATFQLEGQTRNVSLATWSAHGVYYALMLEGLPEAFRERPQLQRDVLNGLQLDTPRTQTERIGGAYVDHRFGYSVNEPMDLQFELSSTPPETSSGASWGKANLARRLSVMAEFAPTPGIPDESVREGVYKQATLWTEKPEYAAKIASKSERSTNLLGLLAKELTVTFDDGVHSRTTVLGRGKLLYSLQAFGSTSQEVDELMSRFQVLP